MAAGTTVIIPPTNEEAQETEENESWQSVLSEVRAAIMDGFSSLRNEMENQRRESLERETRLLEANTNLTSMITQANQTMTDRLTSLIPQQSQQQTPPEVIVEEPVSEEAVPEVVEMQAPPETQREETRRKRRTL